MAHEINGQWVFCCKVNSFLITTIFLKTFRPTINYKDVFFAFLQTGQIEINQIQVVSESTGKESRKMSFEPCWEQWHLKITSVKTKRRSYADWPLEIMT